MNRTKVLGTMVLGLCLQGCTFFAKSEVAYPRFFTPELAKLASPEESRQSRLELRLGRVTAGSYISEKMVYRESSYEIGFYDYRLWTERPEMYLRRALERVLFEEEGLRSIVSGAAPTLDVELVGFEELKAPQHEALVRISFAVHDARAVLLQETLAVEQPIAKASSGREADAVAEALGEALRKAVYEVTGRVLKQLAAGPAPLQPCAEPARPGTTAR